MSFNYDFWYQPHHNVMVSSEWAAPRTFDAGFDPADVAAGKYGRQLSFWNWTTGAIVKQFDLGNDGLIPLELRFHHDPASSHGFCGSALSSSVWHWWLDEQLGEWQIEKVIHTQPVEMAAWPMPVPALITDILLSMDDRFLYVANWFHGDLCQYDVSEPSRPRLTGSLTLGGLVGKVSCTGTQALRGGPQMLQLSLDGKRLYVTNSLYSSWDDQFYPEIGQHGSSMLQVDCDTERGGLTLNEKFRVDFNEATLGSGVGPYRAHEMRYPGGDCTSDIFLVKPAPKSEQKQEPEKEKEQK